MHANEWHTIFETIGIAGTALAIVLAVLIMFIEETEAAENNE